MTYDYVKTLSAREIGIYSKRLTEYLKAMAKMRGADVSGGSGNSIGPGMRN